MLKPTHTGRKDKKPITHHHHTDCAWSFDFSSNSPAVTYFWDYPGSCFSAFCPALSGMITGMGCSRFTSGEELWRLTLWFLHFPAPRWALTPAWFLQTQHTQAGGKEDSTSVHHPSLEYEMHKDRSFCLLYTKQYIFASRFPQAWFSVS